MLLIRRRGSVHLALAAALGVRGTPAFMVGDRFEPGVIAIDAPQKLIGEGSSDAPGTIMNWVALFVTEASGRFASIASVAWMKRL